MGIATRGSAIAIGLCFPIIGTILTSLRFYIRWHSKTPRQLDDWLTIPALICMSGSCISLLTGVFKNAFVKQPPTTPDNVTQSQHILAQITAALVIFWMTSDFLIKLSILFFYKRIFLGRAFVILNWTLIGLSIVWFVYAILSWFLYCGKDLHADFEGGWAACAPWGFDIQMGVFCLDSFIDFFLLVLPIPFLWRLQMSITRKILLVITFLIGGLAFVAGLNNTIIQLVYLTNPSVAEGGSPGNYFQGESLLFSNWPCIEIGVGLIACNLPTLSLRAANALPYHIRRGWNLSLSGIRHAAARLTLRSSSKRSPSHPSPDTTKADGMDPAQMPRWRELPGEEGSAATLANIPLAKVDRRRVDLGEELQCFGHGQYRQTDSPEDAEGKVVSGFDAV